MLVTAFANPTTLELNSSTACEFPTFFPEPHDHECQMFSFVKLLVEIPSYRATTSGQCNHNCRDKRSYCQKRDAFVSHGSDQQDKQTSVNTLDILKVNNIK